MTVDILTRILWGEKVDASYLLCDFGTIRGKDDSFDGCKARKVVAGRDTEWWQLRKHWRLRHK